MATSKTIITLMLITLVSVIGTGCSDDAASPTAVAPVDTAPPAVPANLDLDFVSGSVILSWDQNYTDSDLAGFIVRRENNGNAIELTAAPTSAAAFVDDDVPFGISEYGVFSVDLSGNESAIVSTSYVLPRAHITEDLFDE